MVLHINISPGLPLTFSGPPPAYSAAVQGRTPRLSRRETVAELENARTRNLTKLRESLALAASSAGHITQFQVESLFGQRVGARIEIEGLQSVAGFLLALLLAVFTRGARAAGAGGVVRHAEELQCEVRARGEEDGPGGATGVRHLHSLQGRRHLS